MEISVASSTLAKEKNEKNRLDRHFILYEKKKKSWSIDGWWEERQETNKLPLE